VGLAPNSPSAASPARWFSGDDLLARLSRQLSDLPRGTDEFGADEFCQSGVQAVRIVPTIHRAGEAAEGLFGARPTEHLS
jgi:protein ImuB